MHFRRRETSETWHWCENCSEWPTIDWIELQRDPTSGTLCEECEEKARVRRCNSC